MDSLYKALGNLLCPNFFCFLTCLLSVLIILCKPGNRFLLSVEFFLQRHGPLILIHPFRFVNRALTSTRDRQIEIEKINEWRDLLEEYFEIQHQELRLLDYRDILNERRSPSGSLGPDEETIYQNTTDQLSEIRPRLWENGQAFSRLQKGFIVGSWTIEFSYQTPHQMWQEDKLRCERKLGCCARSCGCCTRPRVGRNGRRLLLDPRVAAHCTIACACCENWRNFREKTDSYQGGSI